MSKAVEEPTEIEVRLIAGDDQVDQDEEHCEARIDGEWREIRFHDYDEIYSIPGLYEKLFYELLECDSPRTLRNLVEEELADLDQKPTDLRVLDLGAGNGMMGEQLAALGVKEIVGIDIIPEAEEAAERDRPEVYSDYHVTDLTDPPAEVTKELIDSRFNFLASVAALGFGDIPPEAFANAFSMVEIDGMICFSIKDTMIGDSDHSGFFDLVDRALNGGQMQLARSRRYQHRLSVSGEPIYYIAMVAHKRGELDPAESE